MRAQVFNLYQILVVDKNHKHMIISIWVEAPQKFDFSAQKSSFLL